MLKLLLLPSLKCALGRCVEDSGLTPPKKIKVIQRCVEGSGLTPPKKIKVIQQCVEGSGLTPPKKIKVIQRCVEDSGLTPPKKIKVIQRCVEGSGLTPPKKIKVIQRCVEDSGLTPPKKIKVIQRCVEDSGLTPPQKIKVIQRCVEDSGLTPPKKIKVIQRYCPEYHERWSCLLHSRKGDSFVLCTVCNINFTCAHGGGNDCKRHVESISHKGEPLKKSQPSCLKFLEAKQGEGQQDIIRAEAMMCDLLVVQTCNHHNPWIYWCF